MSLQHVPSCKFQIDVHIKLFRNQWSLKFPSFDLHCCCFSIAFCVFILYLSGIEAVYLNFPVQTLKSKLFPSMRSTHFEAVVFYAVMVTPAEGPLNIVNYLKY